MLSGARGVLVLIAANRNTFKLSESRNAMNTIRRYASEDAHVIYGTAYDESLGDQLRVTVIATGLSPARRQQQTPMTVVHNAAAQRTGTDNLPVLNQPVQVAPMTPPSHDYSGLSTPSVSVCVGEGGSGGALALAYADRLLIQEHAIFSVIAPEGAAAILERDAAKAPELAARLRLTSADLLDLGIVDEVVREDSESLCRALVAALDGARPGDRRRRFDEVTARWLR